MLSHHHFHHNIKPLPRLIQRNLPYKQSKNNVNVKNKYGQYKKNIRRTFVLYDWYHVFLRLPTTLSLLICMLVWTFIIIIFAFIYMAIDANSSKPECTLSIKEGKPIDFTGAFAFSLETCTTIGYTLPIGSSFFDHCYDLQVAIYVQMALSLLFNAFLIGFFYNRCARAESRASQLLFSEKAIIHVDEDGKLALEVKVYDHDAQHPVVEAHARLYVVHPSSRSDCIQLRLVRPNDEFNAMLFTSIPSRIIHHIDIYSPLMPAEFRHRTNIVDSYGLNLREIDSFTGNRNGFKCPVCSETYGLLEQLWSHIRYQQLMERYSDISHDVEDTHLSLGNEEVYKQKHEIPTYKDLQQFWNDNQMEVIAVVEGIDPLTSGSFQALQSYQKGDIVFGASFAKCFTDDNVVDFDLFHEVNRDEDMPRFHPNHCCTPMQSRQNVMVDASKAPQLPLGDTDVALPVGSLQYQEKTCELLMDETKKEETFLDDENKKSLLMNDTAQDNETTVANEDTIL